MIMVIIGLLALGLLVFIHELGHFIAARLCGVVVTAFSVGMGPILFRKKVGDTEYRISAFPIGGYCSMKGEHDYQEAIDKNLDRVSGGSDTFFGVHPLKRIAIAFSGPLFNLLFAVLVFAIVSGVGHTYQTWENRIILASEYTDSGELPANIAGLETGDRIISLNNTTVSNYSEIQQYLADKSSMNISVTFVRNGMEHTTVVTPTLDKQTGTAKIGVYPLVPLTIGSIVEGSAAEFSGLKPGDKIFEIDGYPVSHFLDFQKALEHKPEEIIVSLNRAGIHLRVPLIILYRDDGSIETGISWEPESVVVAGTGPFMSIANGVLDTGRIITLTVKSIALLFKGVNLSQAVSGPVRITLMIGEVAQQSLLGVAELLGIICVSLFLMNLLPIPVLDGGTILFSTIELILRKPIRPRFLYYIQFIGIAFILFLFVFALFNDISYLLK